MIIRSKILLSLCVLFAFLGAPTVSQAMDWSKQDYDLYSGDFDGTGLGGVLYIAKDPSKPSGIAISDGNGPNIPWQSWQSNYLGIPWSGNQYTVIVGDFNGDGRDDIFLQRNTPGDSYLLLTSSQGQVVGITQVIGSGTLGLTWTADQHRIIAGSFATLTGSRQKDLFLQATSPAGTNYVIIPDATGKFTVAPAQSWPDGYLGLRWATSEALVYAGDFNGDGQTDLLVQAKPRFVIINYDVPFPVPTYPPDMNGVVLAQAGPPYFNLSGLQPWSRNANGVDWSAAKSTITVGNFTSATQADVILQSANGTTYLLTSSSSGAVFPANATALTGSISLAGATLMAFGSGGRANLYVQAATSSGTNYIITNVTGNFTATAQNPSAGEGVITASAAGRTAGQFSVDNSGNANYNIPIWVPSGARGIEPHLALHYLSSAPDGILGPGWTLTGLSAIARCAKTWASDGTPAGVTLTSSDGLCLDGNRLRATTGYTPACSGGTTYQTEIADFSNISACGSAGGGPAYFIVQLKNGRMYEYGNTGNGANSQAHAAGASTPYMWGLDKVWDRQNNSMLINYVAGATTLTPSTIQYTATPANPNAPAGYPYTVTFHYKPRIDGSVLTRFVAGSAATQSNIMDWINVASTISGQTLSVRQYNLGYTGSVQSGQGVGRPLLSSVQECGGATNSDCLQPTMIHWPLSFSGTLNVWGAENTVSSNGGNNRFGFALPLDVAGNGRTDLVYPVNNPDGSTETWNVAIAGPNGYGAGVPTGIAGTALAAQYASALPIDYDGDGLIDIVWPGNGGHWQVLRSTGSGLTALPETSFTAPTKAGEAWVTDIDGDGRQDLVYLTSTFQLAGLHNTSSGFVSLGTVYSLPTNAFFNTIASLTNQVSAQSAVQVADFNGDGRSDLLISYSQFTGSTTNEYISVLYSTGSGYTLASTPLVSVNENLGLIEAVFNTVRIADFNGDGYPDMIYECPTNANVWCIRFGTGNGLSSEIATTIPTNQSAQDVVTAVASDWNGDGMADLIEVGPGGSLQVYSATGNMNSPFAAAFTVNVPNPQSLSIVDVNGDGVLDLAYLDTSGNWHYRLGSARVTDLVDSITDGFNMSASITYAPLTDSSVYTKGSGSAFPTQDIVGPEYVVKQASLSDGLGGTYLQTYSYSAARVNLQGRGSLGFGTVSFKDQRNQVTRTVTYRQDIPNVGTVAEDDQFQPDGVTPISKTTNTPAYMTLAGTDCALISQPDSTRRCFAYTKESVTTRYEVAGSKRGVATSKDDTSYVYDPYGSITSTTAVSTDLDTTAPASPFAGLTWTTVISNSITNDTSTNWCLGRPTLTTTEKSVPNEPSLTRHVQHVIDYGNCHATQEIVEPNDTRLQVATTYTYAPAGCGNVTQTSIVGLDQNGAAMPARVTQTGYGARCIYTETVIDPALQNTSTTYDYNFGVPIGTTDIDNLKTSWTYDDFGRKTNEVRADSTSSSWAYSDCTASSCWGTADLRFLVTETSIDSTGHAFRTTEKYYDGLDRLRFQEGNRELGVWTNTAIAYDNLGRKYQEWVPYSLASNGYHIYTYDIADRLTNDTLYDSGGNAYRPISMTYNGQTSTVQDPDTNITTKVTDVGGELRRVIAPSSTVNCPKGYALCGTTSYDYDAFGNLVTLTDATGVVSSYIYNLRGFKTSATDADTGIWHFTPDSLNELIIQQDANGNTTTLGYDALGRVTSRLEPESTTPIIWTYGTNLTLHELGRLASVTKPDGYSESYTYDSAGRKSIVKYTEDGTTYQFDYQYNASGALDTLTYPVSTGGVRFALKSVYDSNGFLNRVQDASSGAAFWTLNSSNDSAQPTLETLGNSILVASGYTPWTNELVSRSEGAGSATNRQNLSYSWDKAGNLQNRADLIQSLTEVFTVDALNRLSTVTLNGSATLNVTYDSAGDILTKSDVGSYAYADPKHPHAVTAAGSWSIGYDANGNMNSRAGGSISSYSYNLPQQINYNGNSSQFSYDSSHQRWKQVANYAGSVETTHYIGGLFEVVQQGSAVQYRHLIKGGSNAIVYTRSANGATLSSGTAYLTSDHLGSANLVLDSSGNILANESFTPFGARRASNWRGVPSTSDYATFASTSRKGFTGHEMLDSVSLVHMNGRIYDPFLGRFLSADSYIQSLGSSESINPYSYAWNAPLNYVDPTGHSLLGIVGALVGIAVAIFAPEIASFLAGSAETFSATELAVIGGFAGGFVGTYISTGNLSASLTAGLIGGVTGGLFAEIGDAAEAENWTVGERVFGHAFVGCFSGIVSSGNCGNGALSAALSEAAADFHIVQPDSLGAWGAFKGAAEEGLIGGVAARLEGGSFGDGFSVSAAGYLFNDLYHRLNSAGAAATQALNRYNYLSVDTNVEYGGLIYRNPDGSYNYTYPVVGYGESVQPWNTVGQVPQDATVVGDYHTHGDYSLQAADGSLIRTSLPYLDDFNSDNFSSADKYWDRQFDFHSTEYRGYLGTPSGAFKVYNPFTNKVSTLP